MTEENRTEEEINVERKNAMVFSQHDFAKLVVKELHESKGGRQFLKSYKQSEVRDIIENFHIQANQKKLRDISRKLYGKSPQYQRLLGYFAKMATFSHIITPSKDIRKANKNKIQKQYTELGELLSLMNLPHEMQKVLMVAFKVDVFYGYIHRDKKSFYIQHMDEDICKITHVEDGVFNYSINMTHFQKDEAKLEAYAPEIKNKYNAWKQRKAKDPKCYEWVELDGKNTICIKINEEIFESFPPFAGSFDAIFDIEGFKDLRKDKERLGNYMLLTQELPMRKDSENNNDFMIDMDTMRHFHNTASDSLPDNVGIITSPMKIDGIKFDKDRADSDGVAKAERDFWSGSGTSQLLFNADKSTSQGLLMSIKTDEEMIFGVLNQIERWLNRYVKFHMNDVMFGVSILPITHFNRQEMFKMYLEAGQFGLPVKSHLCATVGLSPVETMSMAFLENEILEMADKFIPLQSSHTMSDDELAEKNGRPVKDKKDVSDETARGQDKSGNTES